MRPSSKRGSRTTCQIPQWNKKEMQFMGKMNSGEKELEVTDRWFCVSKE